MSTCPERVSVNWLCVCVCGGGGWREREKKERERESTQSINYYLSVCLFCFLTVAEPLCVYRGRVSK